MKNLQKKIMRGIYVAYLLRLISLPGVWQGFAMLGVMIVLTHFISLGNVLSNLRGIEPAHFGRFLYNAISTTEIWTFIFIGAFVFLSLSFRITITLSQARNQYRYSKSY